MTALSEYDEADKFAIIVWQHRPTEHIRRTFWLFFITIFRKWEWNMLSQWLLIVTLVFYLAYSSLVWLKNRSKRKSSGNWKRIQQTIAFSKTHSHDFAKRRKRSGPRSNRDSRNNHFLQHARHPWEKRFTILRYQTEDYTTNHLHGDLNDNWLITYRIIHQFNIYTSGPHWIGKDEAVPSSSLQHGLLHRWIIGTVSSVRGIICSYDLDTGKKTLEAWRSKKPPPMNIRPKVFCLPREELDWLVVKQCMSLIAISCF